MFVYHMYKRSIKYLTKFTKLYKQVQHEIYSNQKRYQQTSLHMPITCRKLHNN